MQGIYIEELGIKFVQTCLKTYLGNVYFFGAFIGCIFLFLAHKKYPLRFISYYVILLFVTIFNPFFVKYIFKHFHQDEVYYRFFWLLPINIVISYIAIYFLYKWHGALKKVFACLGLAVTILSLGDPVIYISTIFQFPDNLYKVPDDVVEVSELIHQTADTDTPYVAAADDLLMTLRQYDPSIVLTLERDRVLCWQGSPLFQSLSDNGAYQAQKPIMDVIYGGDTSFPDKFLDSMEITQTQYLVYSKNIDVFDFLESLNYKYIGETDKYFVFEKYA